MRHFLSQSQNQMSYVNNCMFMWNVSVVMPYVWFQAELKNLQDIASPSFIFARDLIKHNLVSTYRAKSFWEIQLYNFVLYVLKLYPCRLKSLSMQNRHVSHGEISCMAKKTQVTTILEARYHGLCKSVIQDCTKNLDKHYIQGFYVRKKLFLVFKSTLICSFLWVIYFQENNCQSKSDRWKIETWQFDNTSDIINDISLDHLGSTRISTRLPWSTYPI